MKLENTKLLVCTNGDGDTRPALKYAVWVAELLRLPVHLLGISEHANLGSGIDKLCDETIKDLELKGIPYQVSFDRGRASVVIARYARQGQYITVAGPLGRPAWRRYLQGRSFRRLMAQIETPIIYVPQARIPVKEILLCTGGLAYSHSVARLLLIFAKATQANVTMLHVVEPVTFDYPVSHKLHEHWQDIMHTDTPQGRNLRAIQRDFEQAKINLNIRISHGNAVQEIIQQIKQRDYDLIGMGSMYSAQGLRHLYMPNVTAEVAETVGRPVITVRTGHEFPGNSD